MNRQWQHDLNWMNELNIHSVFSVMNHTSNLFGIWWVLGVCEPQVQWEKCGNKMRRLMRKHVEKREQERRISEGKWSNAEKMGESGEKWRRIWDRKSVKKWKWKNRWREQIVEEAWEVEGRGGGEFNRCTAAAHDSRKHTTLSLSYTHIHTHTQQQHQQCCVQVMEREDS